MNNGGDPGRDDYGLPPVDIEVPDDARELNRDVLAYHRELRSLRRRMLAKRLYGPLTRDGMVLPLLAGCLALTLLAATLLTVFTVGQGPISGPLTHSGTVRPGAASPSAAGSGNGVSMAPATGRAGGRLPDAMVEVDGQPEHLIDLTGPGLYAIVLALIPPGCNCLRDLRELIRQAEGGGAQPYLVGIRGETVNQLIDQTGLEQAHGVEDSGNMLPPLYRDKTLLTAVLVGRDDSVAGVVTDQHGFQIQAAVHMLVSPHAGQSPSPAATQATPTPVTTATPAG